MADFPPKSNLPPSGKFSLSFFMNAAVLVLQDIRMVISTLGILKLNTDWLGLGLNHSEAEEAQYHKVNLAQSLLRVCLISTKTLK